MVHVAMGNLHRGVTLVDSANSLIPLMRNDSVAYRSIKRLQTIITSSAEYDLMIAYGKRALELAQRHIRSDSVRMSCLASTYYSLACLNERRSAYTEALDFVQNGLRFATVVGDSGLMSGSHLLTGVVNHWLKRYDIATDHYARAREISRRVKYIQGEAYAQANIGELYLDRGKHAEAILELRKVLVIIDNSGQSDQSAFRVLRASVLSNIGKVHEARRHYDSAIVYLTVALEDADTKKFGGGFLLSRLKNALARIYVKIGKVDRAEQLANDVIRHSNDEFTQEYMEANQILANVYEWKRNFEKALFHHRQYARVMDTIYNIERQKQITLLQQNLELETREKVIQVLEQQNNLQADAAYYQRIVIGIISVAALFFICLAFIYYVRYRHKQKINALLHSQKREIEIKNAELEQLSIVASKTNNAVIIANQHGEIEWSNNSFELLTGYSVQEWRKMNIHNIFGIRSNLTNERIFGPILDGYQGYIHETKYIHRDGSHRWVAVSVTPVKGERNLKLVVLATDISRIKQAEEQLKHSLREKETLLKEVHHRVKNNLQIVHSLLNWQSEGLADANALEVIRVSKSRIKAMALIHQKLYQSDSLDDIDFHDYALQLVNFLLQMHSKESVRYSILTDGMVLGVNTSITLGLILNEVISNALKYGFPLGGSNSKIEILLQDLSQTHYRFVVRDNGIGLPPAFNVMQSSSLGLRLVATLCEQLEGELHYTVNNGTEFEIIFPKAIH
jgi:PAS domain S-box-containing protein